MEKQYIHWVIKETINGEKIGKFYDVTTLFPTMNDILEKYPALSKGKIYHYSQSGEKYCNKFGNFCVNYEIRRVKPSK